jgi:hypothetical protein
MCGVVVVGDLVATASYKLYNKARYWIIESLDSRKVGESRVFILMVNYSHTPLKDSSPHHTHTL